MTKINQLNLLENLLVGSNKCRQGFFKIRMKKHCALLCIGMMHNKAL